MIMVILDFHVHLYNCYDLGTVLTTAHESFHRLQRARAAATTAGVLLLAESRGYDRFAELRENGVPDSGWQVERTGESCSLRCVNRDKIIYVIRGRQMNTAEHLEVLALCTDADIDDGQSLAATVQAAAAGGGIAVLPWGAGKWTGRRGRIIREFLETTRDKVFLGDNGGRPVGWPEPKHFDLARKKRIPILPGSDPLPLPGEERRVGSYGGILAARLPGGSVASTLRQVLLQSPEVEPVGRRRSPFTFFLQQVRLRLAPYSCGKNNV